MGVKDWEPLLVLPEPGPARCSGPCPERPPLIAGAFAELRHRQNSSATDECAAPLAMHSC